MRLLGLLLCSVSVLSYAEMPPVGWIELSDVEAFELADLNRDRCISEAEYQSVEMPDKRSFILFDGEHDFELIDSSGDQCVSIEELAEASSLVV